MQKPTLSRGTHDFEPKVMARRKHIFKTIEDTFTLFGFMPLETPAMEQLSTLLGKYGEEGDQLIFKIINNGDYFKDIKEEDLIKENYKKILTEISEKGLRYDLTVPFARFVVMNQNIIHYPFKRYQIQPVWRADRPSKGRYREFYQCDADVVGSDSLLFESELIQIYQSVFQKLNIPVNIHLNNRKILEGITEILGCQNLFSDFCVILDKIDKIGWEKVVEEWKLKQINIENPLLLKELFEPKEFNHSNLEKIAEILSSSEVGTKGVEELKKVCQFLNSNSPHLVLDLTLARGLSYYTGTILEVKPTTVEMGSLGGGGRYDNLTGMFGLKDVSGVGISFGADRIYDVMEQLNLFPENQQIFTHILICHLEENYFEMGIKITTELRNENIKTEIYPTASKIKKQLEYANKKNIQFAGIIGENEFNSKQITIKNLKNGEQTLIAIGEITPFIKSQLC